MPRHAASRLSAQTVQKLDKLGRFADGHGLYLQDRSRQAKSWLFRYMRAGKAREMGLGSAVGPAALSLADARERAQTAAVLLRDGIDPLEQKRAGKRAAAEGREATTFAAVSELFLKAHSPSWRNDKHRAQWRATLDTYVLPVMGSRQVVDIDTGDVMKVLEPIWHEKAETASGANGSPFESSQQTGKDEGIAHNRGLIWHEPSAMAKSPAGFRHQFPAEMNRERSWHLLGSEAAKERSYPKTN